MTWTRPPGPPKVWRKVELTNSEGKKFEFTIREIPEDRYQEALDHMCNIFLKDEIISAAMNISDDPESVKEMRDVWEFVIKQNISIGAFINAENEERPVMAGLNMLLVFDDDMDKKFHAIPINAKKSRKLLTFTDNICNEANLRERYNVDRYLGALGLSVDPKFCGLRLGQHILQARDDISCAYNITATLTLFTSEAAQKSAAYAGFETFIDRTWQEIVDEKGEQLFPIKEKKPCKVMGKKMI